MRILSLLLPVILVAGSGAMPAAAQDPSPTAGTLPMGQFVTAQPQPIPPDTQLAADAASALSDAPPSMSEPVDLAAIQAGAEAQAGAMPAQDWGIRSLAAALDYDPLAAFAFLRDSIAFDAYRGALRGAQGTLAARAGNAVDRALLLQALLDEMLLPTQLAFGDLDDATAKRLLDRSFAKPGRALSAALLDPAEAATLDASVTRARRDYARLRLALGDRVSTMDGSSNPQALDDIRAHVWVQMSEGAGWLDLDPSFPDSQPGDAITAVTGVATAIPDAERQAITLTVVAETLANGHLEERPVLTHRFDVATTGGKDIYLTFRPEFGAVGGSIREALGSGVSWQPALYVGSDAVQLGSAFPVRPARDMFAGDESGPVVSALRLDMTTEVPGAPSERRSRTLLDLVPQTLRGAPTIDPASLEPLTVRDGVITELVRLHHLQISTGALNERAHAIWRGVAAGYLGVIMLDDSRRGAFAVPGVLLPLTVADETLALDSERLIRTSLDVEPDLRAFVSRPRLFISSIGPPPDGPGIVSQTDLLSDGVRILTSGSRGPVEAADRQLWYGALEGALETQLGLERATVGDTGTSHMVSTSLDLGDSQTVLDPDAIESLSAEADPALVGDLRDGRLVILGTDPADTQVWWAVDPRSGAARPVVASGLGGQVWYFEGSKPGGPAIEVPDPDTNPDYYDYEKFKRDNAADYAEDEGRSPPEPSCSAASEETADLCPAQMSAQTYLILGMEVAIIAAIGAMILYYG